MDGNKDDALKSLKIGKDALESGDQARALKFLTKAQRLDPSLSIDGLFSSARESRTSSSDSSNPNPESETSATSPSPSPSSSGFSTAATARPRVSSKGSSFSKDYTEEQLAVVHQIKKQKDYYQILGLERSCTVEDVRKAYHKLSLKVHPDKNKAPGAEEAFKAVSKAFQCLSNEETKKRYDLVGSEEPNYGRAATRHQYSNGFSAFYDEEFDPDEIFRNFFNGGGGHRHATTSFGTFHFRTGGVGVPNGNGVQGSSGNFRALIQLIPFIIMILLNFLQLNEPVYMLSRNHSYVYKVETARGVPYFVKSTDKFQNEYPYGGARRMELERGVERDYVGYLSQNCRAEYQRRQWGLTDKMPHCDMLERFQATAV